ncbi:hypothetical protein [Nocardia sp. CS682]|uniref:hypothetical protein n=1 Tax=Nocardia sp. CS682 TaxID=1047172 RepID=UPI001075798B|nr:hypothetical protein [Nocardia sp. CS682]
MDSQRRCLSLPRTPWSTTEETIAFRPRIDADVQMDTRCGITLTGKFYRPADDVGWPVLLYRNPATGKDLYRGFRDRR